MWEMTRKNYPRLVIVTRLLTDVPLYGMFFLLHFGMRGHGGTGNALINGLLYTTWAGIHSLLARDVAKKIVARFVGAAFVRIAYVMFSGVTLALVLVLWQPVSGDLWHSRGAVYWLLTAAYVASILALFRVTSYFDYAEFLGLKQAERSLSDEPARSPVLSVSGPYAYCRHPMYFALLAVFWVGPVMSWGRFEFVLLGTLYLFIGSKFEERNLRRELGAAYDLYCAHVPMWFPRLTPWHYPE
jgi:protein-S-isoprenylcysteine O-methyltransferase Ste14